MIGQMIAAKAMPLLLQAPQTGPGQMTPDQQFQIAMEALERAPEGILGGLTGVLALLVPFAFFAMVFGIVWLWYRHRQAKMRAQAEFHRQLLEKFGSGREFADFLESKGSQRFLEELWSQRTGPHRVLDTMRSGIIMSSLGLGMLVLSWWTRGFRVLGILALALGIGFLISSAISHRLSKEKAQAEPPRVT